MIRYTQLVLGTCLFTIGVHSAHADLPFLKKLAGNTELPRTYGIGVDYFELEQEYDVPKIEIGLPGLSIPDSSVLDINSKIKHIDLRLDAWVFPFLNIFGIAGALDGETEVDLSAVSLPQLPIPLGIVDIAYDGNIFGIGLTAAYAKNGWFGTFTAVYSETNLNGDFDSSANSISLQPRFGKQASEVSLWIGANYLETEESHSGIISLGLPGLAPLPFDVELESSSKLNFGVGLQLQFNESLEASIEIGFPDRITTLANISWRF